MKTEEMKKIIKSYKGILTEYQSLPENIQKYFEYLPELIKGDYEIAIAYLFFKIEQGQNRLLYGGAVKLFAADIEVARNIVNYHHLTRDGFKQIYKNIFNKSLPDRIIKQLKEAEKTRDKVVHGKQVKEDQLRQAITDCLIYAKLVNEEIKNIASFEPFGDMRGFKGRKESLSKDVTHFLLKGLGFSSFTLSEKQQENRAE